MLVNTGQREFDYPAGDGNVFTRYTGRGGVPVASLWRRMMLAIRFGSMKLLLTDGISAQSRVLYRRDIRERVETALPFLQIDDDPYLVIDSAGTLKWMVDGYTSSNRYPYAQPLANGVNYMRNSVKVVVDAYDGTVHAFVMDPLDPIIRSYQAAFPGILRPLSELPADLRAHLRYPSDLFRIQTALYRLYHMNDVETFYHREDEWQIPATDPRDARTDPFMRHMVMRLPGEQRAEYILMTPYTPRQKDNLAAWVVARNDGAHYGELVVYRFPKQSLIYGPRQMVNRINQDTEIARELTLWDQRGSEVIRGELLVIPIEESLLYVQPLYLRAEGGRIPELKRVVVAYQNEVVMASTFDQAIAELFGVAGERAATPGTPGEAGAPAAGGAAGATTTPSPAATAGASSALSAQALEHYERAVRAQRAGDWATYGTELERLGEALRRLAAPAGGATPAPGSTPPAAPPRVSPAVTPPAAASARPAGPPVRLQR